MVSQKQLLANQQNALKSTGPNTEKGKTLAARNSLKHCLLAKEVVITKGEGAEDQHTFDTLLSDLVDQFKPVGSLEEMMVEKIAVCYWRLRRANRYEVGVLREKLDTITDCYYDNKYNATDVEIDEQIEENQDGLTLWQADKKKIERLSKKGVDLESLYGLDGCWDDIEEKFEDLEEDIDSDQPEDIRKALNKAGITDDRIWQMLIESCEEYIDEFRSNIEKLEKDKATNKLRLSARKKKGSLPPCHEMGKLLRYETAIDRQLYKAINQLERLQRLRGGDHVPAPVQMDLNIDSFKTGTYEQVKTEPQLPIDREFSAKNPIPSSKTKNYETNPFCIIEFD